MGSSIKSILVKGIGLEDIQRYTLPSNSLGKSQHNAYVKSDTLFLAELALPPDKLGLSQTGSDVICKNATQPCAWVRNPQFWSYARPRFLG